jgi:putative peptidoglycan lipid II flippase
MQFPQTLFGTAIAMVVFPTLAELYNASDLDGLRRAAAQTLSIVWTLTVPAAVATVLLGQPIIVTLFQGGAFDESATQLVFAVLVAFSIRIVSESTLDVVARLFYARHNTLTPMLAYLGWLVLTVATAYALVGTWGVVGLAFATTIGFTALAVVLLELNRRGLGGLGGRTLPLALGRALAAAAVMGGAIWLVGRVVSGLPYLVLGGGVGLVVYIAVSWLLGGARVAVVVAYRALPRCLAKPPICFRTIVHSFRFGLDADEHLC